MKQLQSVGAALVAGVIGALVWGGIAYFANFEIGWVAWGIGGLVGFAFRMFDPQPGFASGLIAVVITVASICGGKYLGIQMSVSNAFKEMNIPAEIDASDPELLTSYLADQVVAERESAGQDVEWPAGIDPSEAAEEADYPKVVWAEAAERWDDMDEDAREEFADEIEQGYARDMANFRSEVTSEAFRGSFGVLDIVFFLLAIATAFKIAGMTEEA